MIEISKQLFEQNYKDNKVVLFTHKVEEIAEDFVGLLFPQRGRFHCKGYSCVEGVLESFKDKLCQLLGDFELGDQAHRIDQTKVCNHILSSLVRLSEKLKKDAKAILDGDPAAESLDEVVVCYPGFFATAIYRFAHEFYLMDVPIMPRILTEYAHQKTGIDIHPGAKIGEAFVIDHGTGVVIGETTIIGNNVKIFQGVTLGALSVAKKLKNIKRHPTIGDNCVIYSNSTILGGETLIGSNSVVGGNMWITVSLPENSRVYNSK